ncbi:MAG: hypothetical protein CO108_16975 [Deltaproteobacteria bacterium CG_4_9_14_3_um_filter_63_12]|nr:MAG: hypothetical protein CO108_16975 [Deltaproteobacteria bacterium CG_4_9_14_3_um_filter_63_12]
MSDVVQLPGEFATFANASVLWLQEGALLRRLELESGEVSGWLLPEGLKLRGATPCGVRVLLERTGAWHLAWPPFTESEATVLDFEGAASACPLADGGLVLASRLRAELRAFDEVGVERWRAQPTGVPGELLASRDGRWVALPSPEAVSLVDASSGEEVDRVAAPGAPIWAAAVDFSWTAWLLGVHGGHDVFWAGRTQGAFVYRRVLVPGGLATALSVDCHGRALVATVSGELWRLGDHRGRGEAVRLDERGSGARVTRIESAGDSVVAQWSDGSVWLVSL